MTFVIQINFKGGNKNDTSKSERHITVKHQHPDPGKKSRSRSVRCFFYLPVPFNPPIRFDHRDLMLATHGKF